MQAFVRHCLLFTTLVLASMAGTGHALVAVPALRAHVTDGSGILSADERDALERKLQAFEDARGAQLAVLIVPGTAPETIEQYAIRVAETWRLGRSGVDDGLLLLIASKEHALRIEVGYGLEGRVPDALARRVIDETITPHFRRGEFGAGIDAGMQQLMQLIEGEPLPPPQAREPTRLPDQVPLLFLALFTVSSWWRRILGRFGAACLAGGAMALIVWLMSRTTVLAWVCGVLAFVVVLLPGVEGRGSWRGGGSGGGFGGGSGGGFSGGGGRFGGGGASGRW